MKQFVDQMHQTLELADYPQRIISLVPSQTELLYSLGLGDRVVGITKFCVHPSQWYRNKTRIGGTKTVDFDKINALQPDLIIGNKEENTQSEIELLQQQYPVWMSDMQNLESAYEMMELLGRLLGVEEKAQKLVQQLKQNFENLNTTIGQQKKQKAAYFIWKNPYMVAASNTFIDDLLKQAGLENVFANLERYPMLSKEEIQEANPAVMLLSSEPYPFKEKDIKEFEEMCPNAKVLVVDGELFSWYGSRLLQTTDYILKIRQQFEDLKIK